jgi:putative ABC transport system permease protein
MPYIVVDDRYFSTLGISVQQGRTFDSRDRAGRTEVAVVNQAFVRRHFPDRQPIGQRFRLDSDRHLVEIIGVVADGKYAEIDEGELPFVYLSLAQRHPPVVTVIARLDGPHDAIVRALLEMEPRIVIGGVGMMSLDDALGLSLALPLTIAWTTIAFGAIAVAMSGFGLYSTVFYAVSQRQTEIGIRTALGATPADLFVMIVSQTAKVAGAGTILGLGAALALTPLATSIFYGISPVEPTAIATALLAVAVLTLLTTYAVVKPWTRLAALDLLLRR